MTNENKEVIYHRWIKIHADFLVLVLIGIWNNYNMLLFCS